MTIRRLLIALAVGMLLATGCGKKGPLYLPGPSAVQPADVTATQPPLSA